MKKIFSIHRMTNKYYQKHREKLRTEVCERYQSLSEE